MKPRGGAGDAKDYAHFMRICSIILFVGVLVEYGDTSIPAKLSFISINITQRMSSEGEGNKTAAGGPSAGNIPVSRRLR